MILAGQCPQVHGAVSRSASERAVAVLEAQPALLCSLLLLQRPGVHPTAPLCPSPSIHHPLPHPLWLQSSSQTSGWCLIFFLPALHNSLTPAMPLFSGLTPSEISVLSLLYLSLQMTLVFRALLLPSAFSGHCLYLPDLSWFSFSCLGPSCSPPLCYPQPSVPSCSASHPAPLSAFLSLLLFLPVPFGVSPFLVTQFPKVPLFSRSQQT